MRKYLLSAAAVFVVTVAQAADPVFVDPPILPPEQMIIAQHDWSGFYAGVHAGYGWGKRDWDGYFRTLEIDPERFRYSPEGALLGAQIGYNWQWDRLVFGLEADASWSRLRDTVVEDFFLSSTRSEVEVAWLATVRGRVGFTRDRILLYGTGGVAFARVNDVDVTRTSILGPMTDSASATHTGWTAGIGAEAMITQRLSIKGEFLHASFNRKNYNYDLSVLPWTDGVSPDETRGSARLRVNTFKIGLNYHF